MGSLRARVLELVTPIGIGDEIAPGVRLVDASSELGLRLSFELAGGRVLHVDVAPIEEGRPSAAKSGRLSFAYRIDGDADRVDERTAAALCETIASRARAHESSVLARIAADAAAARATSDGTTRIREVEVDRLLERAGSIDERYLTISPYVGCLVGCRFCYAQEKVASVRPLEQLPAVAWGSYVDARVNAPAVLARELATAPPWPIKFCPIVSDPYQAVEARFELTAQCLDVLARETSPRTILILTRARLIARDAARIAALPHGYAGMSIPTIDDDVRRHFEPRAASIDERLETLATLRAAGARTFAVVQPLWPGSIERLADALASAVASVRIDVLHGVHGAAADFVAPAYATAVDDAWQRARAIELAELLRRRGVAVWPGELPPKP